MSVTDFSETRAGTAKFGDAIRGGAEFVDVEWRANRQTLPSNAATRLVVSHHDFSGVPDDLDARPEPGGVLANGLTSGELDAQDRASITPMHFQGFPTSGDRQLVFPKDLGRVVQAELVVIEVEQAPIHCRPGGSPNRGRPRRTDAGLSSCPIGFEGFWCLSVRTTNEDKEGKSPTESDKNQVHRVTPRSAARSPGWSLALRGRRPARLGPLQE